MSEISTTNIQKNNKQVGVKKCTKKSTRVDLTPMVDLGFLLITFFVFTSTMSMTRAMDMNELKDGNPKPVPTSGAMTILLSKSNSVYYYYGILENDFKKIQIFKTDFKQIRKLITDKKKETPQEKLMYIIKSDNESTFGNAMNIVDEMQICGIKPGHYAEDSISMLEKSIVSKF
jgi:biopolymer transport protein ExbD